LDYFCTQIKKISYEKGIFDAAISHITGQLWREKGAEREGSDESENTGGIAWYDG
jgi:hypothetical protein